MSPVRVFIATTAGLVAVQRITEEDPEVNSVVCLAGKAVALPISAAYEAFVRDPTGVIQRHFGHPAYRVDVSATVDEGYSWQLALFAAHALVKSDRLAHPDAEAPLTVIATGEVNRDLHVLDVDHMAEKFGDLPARLAEINADPARTVIAVPRGNADAVRELAAAAESSVLAVAHARELLDRMDIPFPGDAPEASEPEPVSAPAPKKRAGGRGLALSLMALLVAAGAGAAGVQYSPELKQWAAQWVPALQTPKPKSEAAILKPNREADPAPVTKPEPSAPVPTAKSTPAPEPKISPEPIVRPLPKPIAEPAAKPDPAPAPEQASQPASEPDEPSALAEKTPPAPPAERKFPIAPPKPEPKPVPAKVTVPPTDDLKPAPPKDTIETVRLRDLPKDPVELEIMEVRAPPGFSCRDVREGDVEPDERPAPEKGPFAFGPTTMDNLCTVEITASAIEDGMYLFGRYHRWTKSRPGQGPPDKVIDLGPRRGDVHWSVDIPERMRRGAAFQVLIFASWSNFNVPKKLLARIGTKPRSPEARKAVKRLKRRGIAMKAVRFRVIPERRPSPRVPPPRLPRNQSWLPNSGG